MVNGRKRVSAFTFIPTIMRYLLYAVMLVFPVGWLVAQEQATDSLKSNELAEIIVIGRKSPLYQKQDKPLMSVEDYLLQSGKVEMVKRGGYSWEALINNMASERTVTTIDGMRIFGACTDKMDPVTSYVEVSNLSEACITSGAQGNCHGSAIGGSLDLKRNRGNFVAKGWSAALNTGFDTNASQRIIGTAIDYADKRFYTDTDFMWRKADNYSAGNNREIAFSQFGKFNVSATSGVSLLKNKIVEASVIYDKATNVGYPALPMDVSLAEALITSLKFEYRPKTKMISDWETKIYFNTITHRMDDTKRPAVPIHMDMPGWSKTYGFYSKLKNDLGNHHLTFDFNSFYNAALANMTMYPADPSESLMFMDTWPDVRTRYAAMFIEDSFTPNCHSSIKFSVNLANHFNKVESTLGLESLQIFFPEMKDSKNRVLKNIAARYAYDLNGFEYQFGLAFSERAPSVSEGYGFYLFNSFDRYDYIGNPDLKNEKSLQLNAAVGRKTKKAAIKWSAAYFRISDYIIASPDASLIPMTIGASGVKRTTALHYASMVNSELNIQYELSEHFKWKGLLVYNFGEDANGENLPFVSPLRYSSSLTYKKNKFNGDFGVEGNLAQTQFSPTYGEDKTPAYAILNASCGQSFGSEKCIYHLRVGAENILDVYYSTFSDWNNIPRQGRNVFINLTFNYR